MIEIQSQLLHAFNELSTEDAGVTLQAIVESHRARIKSSKTAAAGFKPGDTVRVTQKSGNVGAKYLSGTWTVTKVARSHLWLAGPESLPVLWPKVEDCVRVETGAPTPGV